MNAEINQKDRKILAITHKMGEIVPSDCIVVYRTPHHIKVVIMRLTRLGYLKAGVNGYYITDKGREAIGIEEDKKLTDYAEP